MHAQAHQKVLTNFLDYLHRPEFADVKDAIRDGHALAIFGDGLLSALWQNRDHHYFLTPSFMTRLALRKLKGFVRHPVPRPVKQWFRRQFS